MAEVRPPRLYVLAGTNGAGKSSIGGAAIRQRGADYFNPDEAARRILAANPGTTQTDANSAAWHEGRRLLEHAMASGSDFAFETTLGGRTIADLLERALRAGLEVRLWYVGLTSADLHIARVRARVARGGHDIADDRIRERYDRSRLNLIRLLPTLTELRLYDNSRNADPHTGRLPQPQLVLHMVRGKVARICALRHAPEWTKPILAAALRVTGVR